ETAQNLHVCRQTVARHVDSADHNRELFLDDSRQAALLEHEIREQVRLILQQLSVEPEGPEVVRHETPPIRDVIVDLLHLRRSLVVRNSRQPGHADTPCEQGAQGSSPLERQKPDVRGHYRSRMPYRINFIHRSTNIPIDIRNQMANGIGWNRSA